jgi:hypothetical protein
MVMTSAFLNGHARYLGGFEADAPDAELILAIQD